MNASLDKFGTLFVQNMRDKMFEYSENLMRGHYNAPELQKLQAQLSGFSNEQKQVIRDLVERLSTGSMHDLLFAIQEWSDYDGSVKLLVDGQEIAKKSDGLHGEIFGDEGWIVRFSKFPSETEIESSKRAKEWIAKTFGKKGDPSA